MELDVVLRPHTFAVVNSTIHCDACKKLAEMELEATVVLGDFQATQAFKLCHKCFNSPEEPPCLTAFICDCILQIKARADGKDPANSDYRKEAKKIGRA